MDKPKHIIKECKTHGLTQWVIEGRGYYRCQKCRSANVMRRRKKMKRMGIEYKGGACQTCGYDKCDEALEFHHLDETKKDFGISAAGVTRSFDKMKVELDKCILLCANCHRERHAELLKG